MKKGFAFLVPVFLFVFSMSSVADISLDETFERDTFFNDLRHLTALAPVEGANALPMQGHLYSYLPTNAGSELGAAFDPSAISTSDGKSHCWALDPGEQVFIGQSDDPNIPGGLGAISSDGADLIVSQVNLAIPLWAAQKPGGTLVGSVAFTIGRPGSSHSLNYNLVCRGNGTVRIREIRDGVLARPIGEVFGGVWSPLTTILASSSRRTWEAGASEKGWLTGTQITSPALACIYTFAGVNPIGEQSMPAPFADDPWALQDSGPMGIRVQTIRYTAGPENPLYIDNLYLENCTGGQQITAERLHPFNENAPNLPLTVEGVRKKDIIDSRELER